MYRPLASTIALSASLLASPALASAAADDIAASSADGLASTSDEVTDSVLDNQIVVTATRTPIAVEDAPAVVTIIEAEEIADIIATDIRDLIRYVPGVSVRRAPARFGAALGATGRARNEDFVIRGIGGNRVLIQVDNIRTPQGFSFAAQDAGRGGYTDVSLVKQVEILRGPASALYGSDGLAGVISFTTSDPVDLTGGDDFGGFVRASYSSEDDEFSETVALAGRAGDFSALAAYTRRDFEELESQGTVGGIGENRSRPNPQDGSSDAFLGKLVWERGSHQLRATGEYIATEVFSNILSGQGPVTLSFGPPVPGAPPPQPAWIVDSLTALDTVERTRVSLDWTYTGDGAIDHANVALFWQDGEDVQFTAEDRTAVTRPAPDRERLNTFENETYGLFAEARSEFVAAGLEHTLAAGGDVTFTNQQGLRDGTIPPFGETFPQRVFPETDFVQGGAFIANEMALLGGRLTLFPALRFDFYELDPADDPLLPNFEEAGQSGGRLSPKLGVTFEVFDDVLLFGNYAQGFRAPTPSQVNNFFENLAFGYTSLPNPDLGPERSESWEAGIRFLGDGVTASLVAFRADYEDFISQQVVSGSFTPTDPAVFQFVNFDEVEIEGLEASASYRADIGLTGRFAIAYADGDTLSPGSDPVPLDTIDPLNLVAGLGYDDPRGRFGVELIMTHHARKDAEEAVGAGCGDNCVRPDAFTILDATAFVAINDALKLRAGLFNLTDETYAFWTDVRGLSVTSPTPVEAFTRPGRNASLSLSFQF